MSEKDTTSMAAPSSIGNGNGKGIGNENGNGNGNENGSPTGTVAPVQSIEDASPAGSTPSVTGSTPNANTTGKAKGKKAKAAAAAASTAAGGAEAGTGTGAGTESDMPMSKDRHEPRGRKPNDGLPPSRAREVQRAFRLRRAEHLAALEERINLLEAENSQLRMLLSLPEADRDRIGSGPTGRGKSLLEGGVPMSERVRARKEARARERRLRGLPEPDESTHDESEQGSRMDKEDGGHKRSRMTSTMSPSASGALGGMGLGVVGQDMHHGTHQHGGQGQGHGHGHGQQIHQNNGMLSFADNNSFNLPFPNLGFNLPMTPDNPFDFESAIFKQPHQSNASPNFAAMFSLFDDGNQHQAGQGQGQGQAQPQTQSQSQQQGQGIPLAQPVPQHHSLALTQSQSQSQSQSHQGSRRSNSPTNPPSTPAQPDLLTRLRQCCHLSDSHVVNDPGLLIFATRLCQSFPCGFGGAHADSGSAVSDSEHLLLDDSWRLLRNQLDPGTDIDGENRINTGRMAAELVIRSAHSRGPGGWILCRYSQGMSVKRTLVAGLIQGFGGSFE